MAGSSVTPIHIIVNAASACKETRIACSSAESATAKCPPYDTHSASASSKSLAVREGAAVVCGAVVVCEAEELVVGAGVVADGVELGAPVVGAAL
eukprot:1043853-Rhodomonas_salina.3